MRCILLFSFFVFWVFEYGLQLFNAPEDSCIVFSTTIKFRELQEEDNLTHGTDYQEKIEKYDWSWDDQKVGPLNCAFRSNGDLRFRITTYPSTRHRLDIAVLRNDISVFNWQGHYASVFCVATDRMYFADWSTSTSGGKVVAVDLVSGQEIWRKPLKALGDIQHSSYQTLFNIEVNENIVVVWGNESQGRYVEFKNSQTGETIGHKIFPKEELGKDHTKPTDARTKR